MAPPGKAGERATKTANPMKDTGAQPTENALNAEERAFILAAVAATHDLLVMNQRPDLAPEFVPARAAIRLRPNAP